MGQTITVTSREGSRPEVRFFDTNRSLTGMAIERYAGPEDVHAQRPPDVLAERLFALGATAVAVYSNVVTVEAPVAAWSDLEPKVAHTITYLFHYYGEDAGWSPEALGVSSAPALPGLADPAESSATSPV
jgi:hypothetical protein